MADSDEEYDRKKRDKFRRERSDYSTERRRSDHDRRPSYRDEYNETRKRGRDDDEDRDRRYHGGSPPMGRRGGDWSPPISKRYRRDGWESLRDYGHGMMPGGFMMDRRPPPPWMMGGDMPHGGGMPPLPHGPRGMPGDMMIGFPGGDARQRGSALLTFKQFLVQQDDSIDDKEAIRLYHEYKEDFKKKQLHQFFNDHKEEDWLLAKYHPKRVADNLKLFLSNSTNRSRAFEWFRERSRPREVPLVTTNNEDIVRLMDMAVILMEGGTENDFKALDSTQEDTPTSRNATPTLEPKEDKKTKDPATPTKSKDATPPFDVTDLNDEQKLLADKAKQYVMDVQRSNSEEEKEDDSVGERKRQRESESPDGEDKTEPKKIHEDDSPPLPDTEAPPIEAPPTEPPLDDVTDEETTEAQPETGQTEVGVTKSDPDTDNDQKSPDNDDNGSVTNDGSVIVTPSPARPLHITKAVYIRHIPPHLTAGDILEVCQTIPGYLRLAFAEPLPDKGYERRGWVTFSNGIDILEATARISAVKIKGCQLNCQVNKDLSRRVKPVMPACWARGVVVHDIQQLLKIIDVFDKKAQLWQYQQKEGEKEKSVTGEDNGSDKEEEEAMEDSTEQKEPLQANPLLDIPESLFVVESVSSNTKEKENGDKGGGEEGDGEIGDDEEEGMISDPNTEVLPLTSPLIKVLDELLWYVRLVHSLDYYNFTHFSDEDHMPHRCGIVSARPKPPKQVSSEEVAEQIKIVDEKVAPLLKEKTELGEEEMEKMGKRDEASEVEKFINANTQKLGENKYLCPLSGKKFRGPDFVRKHISNKHKEALEEVKTDTEYFNNYLRDPDRPVPLEGTTVVQSGGMEEGRGRGERTSPSHHRGWGGHDHMQGFHGSRMDHRGSRGQRRFQRPRGGGFGGNRGSFGRRKLHHYDDLDAPVDMY